MLEKDPGPAEQFVEAASKLSQAEYKIDLETLYAGLSGEEGRLKFGRLMGVMLKEPMGHGERRDSPSQYTGAYYDWTWDPERVLTAERSSWQYSLLALLAESEDRNALVGYVERGMYETRIFEHLMQAVHHHICGDRETRDKIAKAVQLARKDGQKLVVPTSLGLAVSASGTISAALTAAMGPWGIALGPLLGGFSLLLFSIGIDTFCAWSAEQPYAGHIDQQEQQEAHRRRSR